MTLVYLCTQLGYAVLSANPFLFVGGAAAVLMGILSFLTVYSYADVAERERMDCIVLGLGGLVVTTGITEHVAWSRVSYRIHDTIPPCLVHHLLTGLVSIIGGDPEVTLYFVG